MAKIIIEFDGDKSVATIHVSGANFMQLLSAAHLLQMEGEGMYAAFRMGESQGKGGSNVIDIARGMPGIPGKGS